MRLSKIRGPQPDAPHRARPDRRTIALALPRGKEQVPEGTRITICDRPVRCLRASAAPPMGRAGWPGEQLGRRRSPYLAPGGAGFKTPFSISPEGTDRLAADAVHDVASTCGQAPLAPVPRFSWPPATLRPLPAPPHPGFPLRIGRNRGTLPRQAQGPRMSLNSPFLRSVLLLFRAWVTAWRRAGHGGGSPAAQPMVAPPLRHPCAPVAVPSAAIPG
jgi:hypothetical protein